jgi:hypothetical protein
MKELVIISGKGGTGGHLGLVLEGDVSTGGRCSSTSTKPITLGARTAATTLVASFSPENSLRAPIGAGERAGKAMLRARYSLRYPPLRAVSF